MIAGTRGRARKRLPAPAFRRGNSGARLPKRGEGRVSGRQLSPSGAGILPRDRRKQGKRARDETPSRAFCALARPPSKRRTERFPACRVPDKTKRGGGKRAPPAGFRARRTRRRKRVLPAGFRARRTRRGRFRPEPPPPRLGKAGDPSRRSPSGKSAGRERGLGRARRTERFPARRVPDKTKRLPACRVPDSSRTHPYGRLPNGGRSAPRLPGSRFLPNTSLRPPSKRRTKRFPARRVPDKTIRGGGGFVRSLLRRALEKRATLRGVPSGKGAGRERGLGRARRTERFPACRVPDSCRTHPCGRLPNGGGNASPPAGFRARRTRRGRFRPEPSPPRLGKAGDPSRRSPSGKGAGRERGFVARVSRRSARWPARPSDICADPGARVRRRSAPSTCCGRCCRARRCGWRGWRAPQSCSRSSRRRRTRRRPCSPRRADSAASWGDGSPEHAI